MYSLKTLYNFIKSRMFPDEFCNSFESELEEENCFKGIRSIKNDKVTEGLQGERNTIIKPYNEDNCCTQLLSKNLNDTYSACHLQAFNASASHFILVWMSPLEQTRKYEQPKVLKGVRPLVHSRYAKVQALITMRENSFHKIEHAKSLSYNIGCLQNSPNPFRKYCYCQHANIFFERAIELMSWTTALLDSLKNTES
ncbi:hypothetical protein BDF20DRAFT_839325 [Mycotypha africana]|uniref:uncharacterized protein n=1 Tax=Mycotypha africana TaxID=64632 RepID=UPI002301181C|nr:uncharacterized protein BDF20DRAFT_839325 [Mycotypha africana]KAI8968204.1 hypothetical protein BDF20DRAFT_839325 [Mycotypha africana]